MHRLGLLRCAKRHRFGPPFGAAFRRRGPSGGSRVEGRVRLIRDARQGRAAEAAWGAAPDRKGDGSMMPGRSGVRHWLVCWGSLACLVAVGPVATPAYAAGPLQPIFDWITLVTGSRQHELFSSAFFIGLMIFALTTAITHVRARTVWAREERGLRAGLETLGARAERAEALLFSEPQLIAVWSGPDEAPVLSGELPGMHVAPGGGRGLSFPTWLDAGEMRALEAQIDSLRARGEAFRRIVRTLGGAFVEADGKAVGGRAVLRMRDVTGDRLELAQLADRHRRMAEEIGAIRALLDQAPLPLWMRDTQEKLTWVNRAYARAVDAADEADALARGTELLDRPAREESQRTRGAGRSYLKRVPAVVGGARRILDVIDIPSVRGSAGMAVDVSELEAVRADIGRADRGACAHARPARHSGGDLRRRQAPHLLQRRLPRRSGSSTPPSSTRSRWTARSSTGCAAQRRLPEQADFRAWKQKLHEAYRSLEAAEHWWHLPGGQTLRVVTTPNPSGGVTYLFEDVTERHRPRDPLQRAWPACRARPSTTSRKASRSSASDGRLRLYNPAFAGDLEAIAAEARRAPAHRRGRGDLRAAVPRRAAIWRALKSRGDQPRRRAPRHAAAHGPGRWQRHRLSPPCLCPTAGRWSTFADVTDSVNFENALVEKNEALEEAVPPQERLRPSRLLRAALAADQHHRLRPASRRRRRRTALRQAAPICRLHHDIVRRVAGYHQQHPRSRDHRCRRHDAGCRRGRHPRRPCRARPRPCSARLAESGVASR